MSLQGVIALRFKRPRISGLQKFFIASLKRLPQKYSAGRWRFNSFTSSSTDCVCWASTWCLDISMSEWKSVMKTNAIFWIWNDSEMLDMILNVWVETKGNYPQIASQEFLSFVYRCSWNELSVLWNEFYFNPKCWIYFNWIIEWRNQIKCKFGSFYLSDVGEIWKTLMKIF